MSSYFKSIKNSAKSSPSIATGVFALVASIGFSGNAAALEFDKEGNNFLGYKGTDVRLKGGPYTPTNAADMDEPAMRVTNPKTGEVKETELVDDTFLYSVFANNQFTWGALGLFYTGGLKDGANNDGQHFRTQLFIDTPWKALKLYGNYGYQDYKHGREEEHLRYGIGFGAPILNGQLLTGYLAKRNTEVNMDGHQLFDGDNGYVFGLKASYKFNKNWTYNFMGEYAWNRQFREVTQETYPGPSFLPIYDLSKENLRETSYKLNNNITYRFDNDLELGVEYLYMKGEASLLKDPGMFGAFIQYAL